MIIVATLENQIRDLGPLLGGILFVGIWDHQIPQDGAAAIMAYGALIMLIGIALSLAFMRLLEGWAIEARFRPVANLLLFVILSTSLFVAVVWRPLGGLGWMGVWLIGLAKLVGQERTAAVVARLELDEVENVDLVASYNQ